MTAMGMLPPSKFSRVEVRQYWGRFLNNVEMEFGVQGNSYYETPHAFRARPFANAARLRKYRFSDPQKTLFPESVTRKTGFYGASTATLNHPLSHVPTRQLDLMPSGDTRLRPTAVDWNQKPTNQRAGLDKAGAITEH
jgi:hypothetical protein